MKSRNDPSSVTGIGKASHHPHSIMRAWIVLTVVSTVSFAVHAQTAHTASSYLGTPADGLPKLIRDELRDGKRKLAQSILNTSLQNREEVSVKHSFQWKLGKIQGSAASTFRSLNESFIFVGKTLYRLTDKSADQNFITEAVAQPPEIVGEVSFVESVEWEGVLYLLVVTQQDLQLFTVSKNNVVTHRQSIKSPGVPVDAEFFLQDEKLFVVVVAQEGSFVKVYRWEGTHLDEQVSHHAIGAIAVSTFPFRESVIISVAVGDASVRKAGLVIYEWSGRKLEVKTFLPMASEPVQVQHFIFRRENYLLVTSSSGVTTICWWEGKGMIVWAVLENESVVHSVGVGYVREETIIFLAEEAKLKLYRPTRHAPQLIGVVEISSGLRSATVYSQDKSVSLLAITESEGSFVPYILHLKLDFQPPSESFHSPVKDELFQCISNVQSKIKARESILQDVIHQRNQLLLKSSPSRFQGKLIVKKLAVKNTNIRSFKLIQNISTEVPLVSAPELRDKLNQAQEDVHSIRRRMGNVVSKSLPSSMSGRLRANQLHIAMASMDSVSISILNGRSFNPTKVLMTNKDQRLTGKITVDVVTSDNVTVGSLNSLKVEDLLRRTGHQVVSELEEVTEIKANKVVFKNDGVINNIPLTRIVTVSTRGGISVSGTKTFSELNLQQMAVDVFNSANFSEWVASLRPPISVPTAPVHPSKPEGKILTADGDLYLKELTVEESINDIPLNPLLVSLFLKDLNQTIKGDLIVQNQLSVTELQTPLINGIPTTTLMTRTTNQTISGSLILDSLVTSDLISSSINGLELSRDAAYVNSPFPVLTQVSFESLESNELELPVNAYIDGQAIGKRLQHQPKIVYEGKVKLKGPVKLTDADLSGARVMLSGRKVDLANLRLNFWTKHSEQVIRSDLDLPTGLNVKTLSVKTINGVSFDNYVDLSSTRVLQGEWHIPSAIIHGDLVHSDGALQAPVSPKTLSSVVIKTSGDYVVSGTKVFEGGITTVNLVTEYLDSKKVSSVYGEDLHKTGNSDVQQIWIGGDLTIRSNLYVGSVNGTNLCEKLNSAVLVDAPGHIRSATISAVSALNINVTTFNGVPFSVIAGAGNNATMQRVRKITIIGDVNVPGVTNVMRVNNKPLTRDYLSRVVDRRKTGVIRGKKTFASGIRVEGGFSASDVNGLTLGDLMKNMLSKTQAQMIPARIRMKEVTARDFKAPVVNNIEVDNLVTTEFLYRQTIEGKLIFTNEVDVSGHLSASSFESGCDLALVNERLQKLDGRHWASLTVEGNLNWTEDLPVRVHGLSYYMDSAVTKDKPQAFSAEVQFAEKVSVGNFISRTDINDIDFASLLTDSLRKSLSNQVIHGNIIFSHQFNATSMKVRGNVKAKKVGGLEIAHFNRSLVRVRGDQEVKGNKRFLQGFTADLLKVDGTVNGLLTSEVACYDAPVLPPIDFVGPLEIEGDFDFEYVNSEKLDDLLQKRVTLDGTQEVKGRINFNRDVTIAGNMVSPRINGLDIADIILRDSSYEQVVVGRKHFVQGLRVEGPMEVDYLDNLELRRAYSSSLFKDKDATIAGDMVFGNIVTIESNLDVETTINNVEMGILAKLLRSTPTRNLVGVHTIQQIIQGAALLLKARGDLSEMLYLEPVVGVPISFTGTHHVVSRNVGGDSYLDVYGWVSHDSCGLPSNCSCPAQYSVSVSSEDFSDVTWNTGLRNTTSQRAFTFWIDNPSVALIVKTNTVSSSTQCRSFGAERWNEGTVLSWAERKTNEDPSKVLMDVPLLIESGFINGFVHDVKLMVANGRIYIILARGYDAELDTTAVSSVIIHVDIAANKARVVTEFPFKGVPTFNVFYSEKGPHIVVGYSLDSSQDFAQVPLEIYRFDEKEELVLLKSVHVDGVKSIVSIVQGGDSLIVVAQAQPYAPVMVLKHDKDHDHFHFMQQLNLNTVPTSLGVFYVGKPGVSDAFLGVSTTDEQFFLYKFCHIEGFKLVMKMELPGVQGFSTFNVGHRQFLFFSSIESQAIFEIIKQSS